MRADYQCAKCNKVIEYQKPYGEEFPEIIEKEKQCQGKTCVYKRLYNSTPIIDVAIGLTGNASTGYKGENVYKSSSFSPNRLNDYPTRHKYLHNEQ
jgi:DNA-directed RNA polymerase subunit RPC12/RpoP